jgi:serine/threonine protein kinase
MGKFSSSSSDSNYNSSDESQENLDLTGKILNNYNVIYEIGKGADAIVWLAFNVIDSKFYAIKVNEPNEYKKGCQEFKFLKKLNPKLPFFNHLKESFVEQVGSKKYACGVFDLHTGNLDAIVRKGEYQDGLPVDKVKKIMYQLLLSLHHLHTKMKVYHADIKTDNILLRGCNNMDKEIMKQYSEAVSYKDMNNRKQSHQEICENLKIPEKTLKYCVGSECINNCIISLSDFGAFCGEDEHYDTDFGTRYYRAPEVILVGQSSFPVDIWAAGCVFYELLTGRILFDPERDDDISRDEYHLYYMNSRCGNFSTSFLKKTKYGKKYFTSDGKLKKFNSLDDITFEYSLDKYGIKEFRSEILDLLKGMLTINPNSRFTAEKCLLHPFFSKSNE